MTRFFLQLYGKACSKGFGYGLAAGAVNFGIDTWSNSYEDEMHKESKENQTNAEKADKTNSIGVNALKV